MWKTPLRVLVLHRRCWWWTFERDLASYRSIRYWAGENFNLENISPVTRCCQIKLSVSIEVKTRTCGPFFKENHAYSHDMWVAELWNHITIRAAANGGFLWGIIMVLAPRWLMVMNLDPIWFRCQISRCLKPSDTVWNSDPNMGIILSHWLNCVT